MGWRFCGGFWLEFIVYSLTGDFVHMDREYIFFGFGACIVLARCLGYWRFIDWLVSIRVQ